MATQSRCQTSCSDWTRMEEMVTNVTKLMNKLSIRIFGFFSASRLARLKLNCLRLQRVCQCVLIASRPVGGTGILTPRLFYYVFHVKHAKIRRLSQNTTTTNRRSLPRTLSPSWQLFVFPLLGRRKTVEVVCPHYWRQFAFLLLETRKTIVGLNLCK